MVTFSFQVRPHMETFFINGIKQVNCLQKFVHFIGQNEVNSEEKYEKTEHRISGDYGN